MNMLQIQYFLDAAETHSLHKSAERFNITPQGLSKALRNLEQELGLDLIERSARGVFLTENGLALQENFREMQILYKKIEDYCNNVNQIVAADRLKGEIRLAVTTRFADSFFSRLINKFKEIYPLINFHFIVLDNYQTALNVQNEYSGMNLGIISIVHTQKKLFDFESYCREHNISLTFFYDRPMYFCGTKKTIKNITDDVLQGIDEAEKNQPAIGYRYSNEDEYSVRYQINSINAQKNMIACQNAYGAYTLDEFNMYFNQKNYAYCAPAYELTLKYAYIIKNTYQLQPAESTFLRFLVEYFSKP